MKTAHYPKTPAIHFLKARHIAFTVQQYPFEEHGGTKHASIALNVSEHLIVKTLVMEGDSRYPFLMLMHGDCEVSLKQLAREIGVKRVAPCDVASAQKYTGYLVGGISPFGARSELPVYAEATIFGLEKLYINGGKRGLLVEILPEDLRKAFPVQEVTVAIHP